MRLVLLGHDLDHRAADEPVFTAVRPRLLLARPDPDRRRPVPGVEGDEGDPSHASIRTTTRNDDAGETLRSRSPRAIFQILLLDLVFSIDSIITAVGMTDEIAIMYHRRDRGRVA